MDSGTNLERVRDYNQGVVLEAIRSGHGISRVEIAAQSGLTPQTVSNIVKRLLDQGIVVEDGREISGGGKPRVRLRVNPTSGYALGAQIDRDECALVLVDLTGRVVGELRFATQQELAPEAVVERVGRAARALVDQAQVPAGRLLGMGVACPGPLDQRSGVVFAPPNFVGWREVPLRDLLSRQTGYRVLVDNDAMAAAIGERWRGGASAMRNFAFIYFGVGIGAGLFIDNRIFRGTTTNAGDFGHMVINIEGPLCDCGNPGCVEVYCSPRAILSSVRRRLRQGEASSLQSLLQTSGELSYQQVVQATLDGDALASNEIARAARLLGYGLINMVHLLDVDQIILGGPSLRGVEQIVLAEAQRTLSQGLMARDWRQVQLSLSSANETAVPIGAAALVLYELYSPRLTSLRAPDEE